MLRTKFHQRLTQAALAGVTALSLAACSIATASDEATSTSTSTSTTTGATSTALTSREATTVLDGTHADANDGEYDVADATTITLADGASKSSSDNGVKIEGDTITITTAGTYLLSGSLSDGQIVVNSDVDGKVVLVLDGVDITSTTTSPIAITAADEAVVVLAEGSTNTISDGADSGADDEETDAPNATLFSMADLTIAGSGALNVTGVSADGITSKDGLVILAGQVTVDSADDGIHGKDYVVVNDGALDVTAGGDGLKSSNDTDTDRGYVAILAGEVTIVAGSDGIDALTSLLIADGIVKIEADEGLEAVDITIDGGTVDATTSDDGINGSSGDTGIEPSVTINGGEVTINSEGDGLDSNGSLTITGGTITVNGPSGDGNGAMDVDGTFIVEGGTLIAAGSAGMAVAPPTDSAQKWVSVTFESVVSAGSIVDIINDSGDVVATYTAVKDISSLIIAADDISADGSYAVQVDGSEVTTVNAMEHTGGRGGGMGGPGDGERPDGGGFGDREDG